MQLAQHPVDHVQDVGDLGDLLAAEVARNVTLTRCIGIPYEYRAVVQVEQALVVLRSIGFTGYPLQQLLE